jgi:hypothetical protein
VVCPVKTAAGDGATVTEPTGTWSTNTVDVPVLPSLVAVIVAVPVPTPVTTPVAETVAIAVALELHVTMRPVSVLPPASFVMAVNACVVPATTLAETGLTVTVATGTGTTLTVAVPVFPSLVAVIVAVPRATPLTKPPEVTVAMPVLSELHVMARPVRTAPFASRVVAVRVAVAAIKTFVVGGATVTVLTGAGVTVTVAVPLFVSLVAVIVAVPCVTPVTTPVDETVATAVLLELQATCRSVTTVPFTSFTVALSDPVVVAGTEIVDGETVTLPTGIVVTVIEAVPDLPSLVAVIVAVPPPTPDTVPVDDTVATALLLDVHTTVRPVSVPPF